MDAHYGKGKDSNADMSETEFIRRWNDERPQFEAWGSFVVAEMKASLSERLGSQSAVEYFLKIPPSPRVKDIASLVDKAYTREKAYTDPYVEITDKVGVRFVVLLNEDVRLVEELLRTNGAWIVRKDRDYEEERESKPWTFTYQSLHYVVFAKQDTDVGGTLVRADTPCEVQIRTLLQHAHSELSHPNIYKPRVSASTEMIRVAARTMALVETADDYFDQVVEKTRQNDRPLEDARQILDASYRKHIEQQTEGAKANTFIIDALLSLVGDNLEQRLDALVASDGYIVDRIKQRRADKSLYRKSSVLLLYLLVKTGPAELLNRWPLQQVDLRPLFIDLGVAMPAAARSA